MCENFKYSVFLSATVSLNFGHFSGYVLASGCGFNLCFPIDERCGEYFYVTIGHLNVYFIDLFFFLLLSHKSFYYFWYKSFVRNYWQYYILVCGLPFHFLIGILPRTEVFNFDEVQFFNMFLYIEHVLFWGVLFRKPLSPRGCEDFLLCCCCLVLFF